jgi:hypothetical protein
MIRPTKRFSLGSVLWCDYCTSGLTDLQLRAILRYLSVTHGLHIRCSAPPFSRSLSIIAFASIVNMWPPPLFFCVTHAGGLLSEAPGSQWHDALLPKLPIEVGDREKVPAHVVGDVVKSELDAQGPIQDGQYGLMTRS